MRSEDALGTFCTTRCCEIQKPLRLQKDLSFIELIQSSSLGSRISFSTGCILSSSMTVFLLSGAIPSDGKIFAIGPNYCPWKQIWASACFLLLLLFFVSFIGARRTKGQQTHPIFTAQLYSSMTFLAAAYVLTSSVGSTRETIAICEELFPFINTIRIWDAVLYDWQKISDQGIRGYSWSLEFFLLHIVFKSGNSFGLSLGPGEPLSVLQIELTRLWGQIDLSVSFSLLRKVDWIVNKHQLSSSTTIHHSSNPTASTSTWTRPSRAPGWTLNKGYLFRQDKNG